MTENTRTIDDPADYLPAPELDAVLERLKALVDQYLAHQGLAEALADAYDRVTAATIEEYPIWPYAAHYQAWAARFVPEEHREHVATAIHRLLRDDPTLTDDHSWPQLRWLAEFGPEVPTEVAS
jgi:hypothetical protein